VTTCLYDVTTGQKKTLFSSDYQGVVVTAWAISEDGKILAVAELRCTEKPVQVPYWQIVIRKLATGEELARFLPEPESIASLALSQDGSWLMSGLTSRIGYRESEYRVCQVANQFNTQTVGAGKGIQVAFSPDFRKFAIDDEEGMLQLALLEWIDLNEEMRK
jgi:hypothetical protein